MKPPAEVRGMIIDLTSNLCSLHKIVDADVLMFNNYNTIILEQ